MDNISLSSLEAAVDYLVTASPKNNAKGNQIKKWFSDSFSLDARVSHTTEDKALGNRVSEQFRHKAPVVVFVCSLDLNLDTLVYYIKRDAYAELSSVLIMSDVKPYNYHKLLVFKDNEFTTWVTSNTNVQRIDVEPQIPDEGFKNSHRNIMFSLKYRPFITAIKSKPFLLLAGISGTGKSRIVRELARSCWPADSTEFKAQKPSNFEMVQVKPNWHDSSELIGYVSRINGVQFIVGPFLKFMVRALKNPGMPYFLCLDEMNLAPVEQYFAEFLSVIESRKADENGNIITDPIIDYSNTEEYKSLIDQLFPDDDDMRVEYLTEDNGKRLRIPQNLIVIGTVNMDETTFSFSRKVLDRAMTIEMNDVDLKGGLTGKFEPIGKLGEAELIGKAVEGVDIYSTNQVVCDTAIAYLQEINNKLEGTPFKVAYRTRNEFLLYVVNNLPYNKDENGEEISQELVIARALDEITSMKVLSRIEGDEAKVSKSFLEGLKSTVKAQLETIAPEVEFVAKINQEATEGEKKQIQSISLAKLDEMISRLESGYTSFWS